jgi:hypothetical protein
MRKSKRGVEALGLVTEALKSIHPGLERISILSVGGYLVPQFHMLEPSGKRHVFNVSQMWDGTLRVLGLLVALYQEPRPAVIALEEPEQTVNPAILSVIADAIKEVSKRSQILVTTHSPHLLDQFDASEVRSVELHDGRTVVGPVIALQIDAVRERLFSLGELLVSEGLHSWSLFLHCLREIAKHFPEYGWRTNQLAAEGDPEAIRDAKGRISAAMRERAYKPTRDQEKFITPLDYGKLRRESPSFRRFEATVLWLAGQRDADQQFFPEPRSR